ncbi:dermatopontin 2 [Biomphalaria pfeifferi]|uniref:Dermatopontin 2 n=1 Tax=Biomphalaria pfeifferi TaxID=112525 RepID=A0AAD8BQK4_BIOPF|nr:dermatopontin 2 [Biomphalaria pfeifferi]
MPRMAAFLVIVSLATVVSAGYVNDWDSPFNFRCPDNQIISYTSSIHDNRKEDRRWEFLCRTAGKTHSCIDSGYVNEFDEPIVYTCPGNKVMVGAHSYHSNKHEDRKFGFYCCDIKGKSPRNCYDTGYVNDWDQKLTLVVPEGKAIKAAFSHHDNRREDRRWKYQICTL